LQLGLLFEQQGLKLIQIHHEIIEILINVVLIDLQLIGELINRITANINVKKLQFIHMLTATDLRTSNTAKNKEKLFYHTAAH